MTQLADDASATSRQQHVNFSGLEMLRDREAAQVYFQINGDGDDQPQDISFVVDDEGVGADVLIAKGYDALISALRQMLTEATSQKELYDQRAKARL